MNNISTPSLETFEVAVSHAQIAMEDFERAVRGAAEDVTAQLARFNAVREQVPHDQAIALARIMSDALDTVSRALTTFDLDVMLATHDRLMQSYKLQPAISGKSA